MRLETAPTEMKLKKLPQFTFGFLCLGLLCGTFAPETRAAQSATVATDEVSLHEMPDPTSPVLQTLGKGEKLVVSSSMVQGSDGSAWHKAKLENGLLGYVHAKDILTAELVGHIHEAQLDFDGPEDLLRPGSWCFSLRGMGAGGFLVDPQEAGFGGEGEASVCIPIAREGYRRRMLSVGGAYVLLGDLNYMAGSLIFRVYTDSFTEPEFRLRAGVLDGGDLAGAFHLGVRHVFGPPGRVFLSGYFEVAGLSTLKTEPVQAVWAAFGLGLHF